MLKLIVVRRDGAARTITAKPGHSVMELIRDSGCEEILALCGGQCACGTCHVYVDPAFMERLPGMSRPESELLEAGEQRRPESRLSCQIPFTAELDGLKVTVAPD